MNEAIVWFPREWNRCQLLSDKHQLQVWKIPSVRGVEIWENDLHIDTMSVES